MLKFNPNDRASADECLKSPIFDSFRTNDMQSKINVKIDEQEIRKNQVVALINEIQLLRKQSLKA